MSQPKWIIIIKNMIPVTLGTALYAFGLHYFVISNELMEGGVTGIALLINYSVHIPPSITTLALNIPLFFLGWRTLGRHSMLYTLWGTLSLSFFLWVMETLISHEWIIPFTSDHDYLLAALYAGVTLGSGLGLVFRFGATTGGTDIIAQLGNRWRGWSVGQVILVFDAAVILVALFYLPQEKVLYSLISIFISTRMIDFITQGAYAAKAFTIITDKFQLITETITTEMDRGVTLFPARGAFSKETKEVIYCIVSRSEVRTLKLIIHRIDPSAFIIISDVNDVLGEGFRIEKHSK
ncbi:YitT family protein [Paenibacillus psychroresistens]|uniref:YitT family protein n=1 Tax=Paenibacillus psychroresistens TaxID=1778678 RepID=A0A6B8RNB6_9BACL|nr:YitT family protein [Paenibacillus psychroresistens]QGQ96848.1 YitT family protein [Paenibacillus psychroresistens]